MQLNGFTEMDLSTKKQIVGGAWFTTVLASIPILVSGIATLAGAYRVLFSDSGEIKTKEGLSQKWDKSNGVSAPGKISNASTTIPIYYVY